MSEIIYNLGQWVMIGSCAAAYTWVVYAIGYKKGQDVIHEWYAKGKPE